MMASSPEIRYRVTYAEKRIKCRACLHNILKKRFLVGVYENKNNFVIHWYHLKCIPSWAIRSFIDQPRTETFMQLTENNEQDIKKIARVYQVGNKQFITTLLKKKQGTGIIQVTNLQILKHDKENKFWVQVEENSTLQFRSMFTSGKLAIQEYENIFRDIINSGWQNKKSSNTENFDSGIKSHLAVEIQNLMKLIVNTKKMEDIMIGYGLDKSKMSPETLSEHKLNEAYMLLTFLQELLSRHNDLRKKTIFNASNLVYNLLPHTSGDTTKPILDNLRIVKKKMEMINTLMDIRTGRQSLDTQMCPTKNRLDVYFKKLNTKISVLDKYSNEFKIIQKYMKNTHSIYHKDYKLEIEDIFTIKRYGENERFKKLKNRMLLWHGSKTSNFFGILSQGLKIATPGGKKTALMFGKGIYFADRVSKSANYCGATLENPTGLLLLCEVSLGKIFVLPDNFSLIRELQKPNDSVLVPGLIMPDPNESEITSDGLTIPYGRSIRATVHRPDLKHNEYIVYDESQVKIKYIVKVNFQFENSSGLNN